MKISKQWKRPGLHKCTKNNDQMLYCAWDMARVRCNCYFSFWAIFRPFTSPPTPLTAQKLKTSQKQKKYLEVPKIMIIYVIVPEIWHRTDVIVRFPFGLFYALLPPNRPKNKNFRKMKNATGDVIILHNCTKNHDHMLYCSWHMVCEGCNWYFSF